MTSSAAVRKALARGIVAGLDPDPEVAARLLRTTGRLAERAELAVTAVAAAPDRPAVSEPGDAERLVYWEGAPELVPLELAERWQDEQHRLAIRAASVLPVGVTWELQVRPGRFVAQLERTAAEREASLIAVSGPGRRRWTRLQQEHDVLGLVHRTRRLVLVVPRAGHPDGPIHRILVAVDALPTSAAAVAEAGMWSRRLGADVRVVQAWEEPRAWMPALESPREARDRVARFMGRLRGQGVEVSGVVRTAPEGFAPDVLVQEAHDCHADLIVRGTRGLGPVASHLLKGTTRDLLANAPVPVLVVR